jgi:H+/Cl- antiporter ClcA
VLGVGFVRLMERARTHATHGARAIATITIAFAVLGFAAIPFPELLGNGKGQAQLAFVGSMSLALAVTLVFLKPLATAMCLRAGAIGGLLTPALATGAVLGVALGHVTNLVWSGAPIGDFAMVGAAALLAVTQRAPFMAIAMTLELTRSGLPIIVPIAIAVGLALVVARLIDRSIRYPGRSQMTPWRGVPAS